MPEREDPGFGWLIFCASGLIASLTLYGILLEYATSNGRKLHEISYIFVTTSIYALTAYTARGVFREKPSKDISRHQLLMISLLSIASAYTSVRSLRYVIYPVQVLFKSCKPVPVMLFGLFLGQKYSMKKYVNVIVITIGVALFMGGGSSTSKKVSSNPTENLDTTLMGALMLTISLCFDGATGAYEDKLMSGENSIGPYDLMFNIQLGKAIISFCALIVANGVSDFVHTISEGGVVLLLLGFTGAIGQVFLFITISKFGALNCALLGLFRKMLSLMLSFVLYGHTINAPQTVGLVLSIAAMSANFMGGNKDGGHGHGHGKESGNNNKHHHDHSQGYTHLPTDEEAPVVVDEEEEVDEDTPLMVSREASPATKRKSSKQGKGKQQQQQQLEEEKVSLPPVEDFIEMSDSPYSSNHKSHAAASTTTTTATTTKASKKATNGKHQVGDLLQLESNR